MAWKERFASRITVEGDSWWAALWRAARDLGPLVAIREYDALNASQVFISAHEARRPALGREVDRNSRAILGDLALQAPDLRKLRLSGARLAALLVVRAFDVCGRVSLAPTVRAELRANYLDGAQAARVIRIIVFTCKSGSRTRGRASAA